MSRLHPKPNILVSQHLRVISPLFEIRMHVGLYENIIQEVEAWDIDMWPVDREHVYFFSP